MCVATLRVCGGGVGWGRGWHVRQTLHRIAFSEFIHGTTANAAHTVINITYSA